MEGKGKMFFPNGDVYDGSPEPYAQYRGTSLIRNDPPRRTLQ